VGSASKWSTIGRKSANGARAGEPSNHSPTLNGWECSAGIDDAWNMSDLRTVYRL
jgi:hypothetical protein